MANYIEILRRREAGESFNEIGRALGLSPSSAKRYYRAEVPYTGPMRPIDEPFMRRLWAEGLSYKAIGAALGISVDSFDGYRRRLGLPPRPTKQPPCNIPEQRWTEAEKAIVIKFGYDVTAAGLAMRLPGRSEKAAQALRKRLTRAGIIARPAKIAGTSRADRRAAARVEREARPARVVVVKPPKPAKIAHPTPARLVLPPLPPEPAPGELPAGSERFMRRTWGEIQRIGIACGVVMVDKHDLDRLNRTRERLRMPPVYMRFGGVGDGR